MQPSPFALQLMEEVRPILRSIERVLSPQDTFDPKTSTRSFRVAIPDFAPGLFPNIAKDFLHQAPHATLEWQNVGEKILDRVLDGHVDICIAPSHLRVSPGISCSEVGALTWSCFMRRKHPALTEAWGTTAWQQYPHVAVQIGDTPLNPISMQSKVKGLSRRVAVWVPNFGAIAPLLAQSNLIATMPRVLMLDSLSHFKLVEQPVPFSLPPIALRVYWASRYDNEPANQWLRQMLTEEFASLTES